MSNDGASAAVFDMEDGTVLKAYRRRHQTQFAVGEWSDHEAIIRAVWANEVRAYHALGAHPDLNRFVPTFFGCDDPLELLGPSPGEDLPYVRGCGIRLQLVPGVARKLAHLNTVTRIFASWNQLDGWLRQIEALRHAA